MTDDLKFVVDGEIISYAATEAKDKIDHVPTTEENMLLLKYEEDRKRHSWASQPNIRKYDYVYNGHISITINGKKSFRDRKTQVIEDRLGDIMIEFYEATEDLRKQRTAAEEVARQREEARQKVKRRNVIARHSKSGAMRKWFAPMR